MPEPIAESDVVSGGSTQTVQELERRVTELEAALAGKQQMLDQGLAQERYRQIFEHSPLGLVHYDVQGTIVDCNSVYLGILGAEREQIIGINLIHDLRDQRVIEAVRRSLTDGHSYIDIIYQSVTTGRVVPVRAFFNAVRDEHGAIAAGIGIVEDCTERRAIEARLRANEERLRLAVDAAHIGIWEVDLEHGRVHWDNWMWRLHGVTKPPGAPSLQDWRSRILAADRFRATRAMLMATRVERAQSERLRVVLPTGECRHLRLHARRIGDEEGGAHPRLTGVCYDVTEQHLASTRIEQLALFDALTGLPNRRLLIDRLRHAVTLTQRQASHRALLLLDLDGFKQINDTRGHAAGDQLLIAFAERLHTSLRRTDTAARLGGDEFVVLCEGLNASAETATQEAARIASKLALAATGPYRLGGAEEPPVYCSASIGITLFSDESWSADELMKQADIAMYEAKRNGRDTWRFFEAGMQQAIEQQEFRIRELRRALAEEQLALRYMPQVDQDGNWCGCEALVRWAASEHELRRPDEFLGLAEASGLIQAIDDWVLARACRDFASMTALPPKAHIHLGVNVSIRQLLDIEFAERVLRTVEEAGLEPRQLRLEVTEQALFVNLEQARTAIERLQRSGVAIVLDDFGTGSSSLLQLQRLSLHAVKIGQVLIRDIEHSSTKLAIVRAAISVARALSLPVIAEGVERDAQYRLLRDEGCSVFQGYYFAAPMPLRDFSRQLARTRSEP